MSASCPIAFKRYPLSFSLGVVRGGQASSIEEILAQADTVMYQEKQRKRHSHTLTAR